MSPASRPTLVTFFFCAAAIAAACRGCAVGIGTDDTPASDRQTASNFLLVTIDTLRADAVGAYGSAARRTHALDALAAAGVRFDAAFAPTPITLPSHASLLTGLYPPGHGSRHNGIAIRADVPTLATVLEKAGLATGAFVSAFPLDRRFGLARGFSRYGDKLPRPPGMRPLNERPGDATVSEAVAWLKTSLKAGAKRFFLWVHLFEPHAPYGNPRDGRPAFDRYMDDVAEADGQLARLLDALGPARSTTLIAVAGDHGEAFGEHGEIGHSIFVYDTTLRVPLVMAGPGVRRGVVSGPVSLVDVAPTALARLGLPTIDSDGVDLSGALDSTSGAEPPRRTLYAESFAPLLDFGWSALRSIRRDGWKYIAAPRPELFHVSGDPAEATDRVLDEAARAAELEGLVSRISGPDLPRDAGRSMDPDAERRLRALGYIGGTRATQSGPRPDPKDRRELAARLARVTSGELEGDALRRELEAILREDDANPQAHVRLGFVLADAARCSDAERHFKRAIALRLPSADPYLGLAGCQAAADARKAAIDTLEASKAVEKDNPVVLANLGSLRSEIGDHTQAVAALSQAVSLDPDFHQARFYLALALARAGRKDDAAREARTLLERLPADAPQRPEVDRLLRAVQ